MWHLFIFRSYPFSTSTNRLTNAGCQTYCWLKNTKSKQNFSVSSKHKLLNEIHSGVKMVAYFVLFVIFFRLQIQSTDPFIPSHTAAEHTCRPAGSQLYFLKGVKVQLLTEEVKQCEAAGGIT